MTAEPQMDNLQRLCMTVYEALGPDLITADIKYDELTIDVYAGAIVRVLTILRDHPDCNFKMLVDLCGVDCPNQTPRFQVVYHLLSIENNHRIRVRLETDADLPVPSVTDIFNSANWYEREAWDLFGIAFADHPDLRRILTDYNFDGHPLRKDFPLSGYVEVRYDPELKRVVYEPVQLTQNFRNFDFLSPWEGVMRQPEFGDHVLPGDEKVSK